VTDHISGPWISTRSGCPFFRCAFVTDETERRILHLAVDAPLLLQTGGDAVPKLSRGYVKRAASGSGDARVGAAAAQII
jgi:hypothetical protein